jgi:threonine dehydrogenase-like Zn-dependent dehydrogenase
MNAPYTETIRGEVSIFRGGAGGLSYVSRGPFNGAIRTGASWAIAPGKLISRIRKEIRRACEAVEDFMDDWSGEALNDQSGRDL